MGRSIKNPRMAAGTTMRGRSVKRQNYENEIIIAHRGTENQGEAVK